MTRTQTSIAVAIAAIAILGFQRVFLYTEFVNGIVEDFDQYIGLPIGLLAILWVTSGIAYWFSHHASRLGSGIALALLVPWQALVSAPIVRYLWEGYLNTDSFVSKYAALPPTQQIELSYLHTFFPSALGFLLVPIALQIPKLGAYASLWVLGLAVVSSFLFGGLPGVDTNYGFSIFMTCLVFGQAAFYSLRMPQIFEDRPMNAALATISAIPIIIWLVQPWILQRVEGNPPKSPSSWWSDIT